MPRLFLFLILLVPLAASAIFVMDHPGVVTVYWFDYEIRIALALVLIALLLLLVIVSWVVLIGWQFFSWPKRRRYKRRYQQMERGLYALSHAVTSLAMQDVKAAEKSLKQAMHFLPESALPRLIAAQVAGVQGNATKSSEHLRHLLGHKETVHFATRKLIDQQVKAGAHEDALRLAVEADTHHPRDPFITRSLIDLYLRAGRYRDVLQRTEGWKIGSPLGEGERRRLAAISHYFLAQEASEPRAVYRELRHATHFAPEFAPATLALIDHLQETGQTARALRLIKQSWNASPPSALVQKALTLIRTLPPTRQARFARRITAAAKNSAETAYLRASIAAGLGKPEEAAEILRRAIGAHDRKILYALMAEISPQLDAANEETTWLKRAMDAPAEPHWHCRACGAAQREWELHCHQCGALDSSIWQQPELTKTEIQPRS
jgi:HemY protein